MEVVLWQGTFRSGSASGRKNMAQKGAFGLLTAGADARGVSRLAPAPPNRGRGSCCAGSRLGRAGDGPFVRRDATHVCSSALGHALYRPRLGELAAGSACLAPVARQPDSPNPSPQRSLPLALEPGETLACPLHHASPHSPLPARFWVSTRRN